MTNALSQLSKYTTIVADTGDFQAIDQYKPQDATTNPSLILKAVADPKYQHFLEPAVTWAKAQGGSEQEQLDSACDMLAVMLGKEILNIVPGYVSTEVDARLSFDTAATIAKAKKLIAMYDAEGIDTKRVLIKIASTWEGIKAAEVLEKEGIKCNLTLLFNFSQAVACAQANIFLISPFVGRIADWYKKNSDVSYAVDNGPGVQSVRSIYNYYKTFDYKTIVMGASFRNTDQIKALAGCDRLTIAPALLEQLSADNDELKQALNAANATSDADNATLSESAFRWAMSQDPMATDKLAEGIRGFAADQDKLIGMLRKISERAA